MQLAKFCSVRAPQTSTKCSSEKRGKIHLQSYLQQVRHIFGEGGVEVTSAPKKSINPDTNKINGLKFLKWLKQSMLFQVHL